MVEGGAGGDLSPGGEGVGLPRGTPRGPDIDTSL